MSRRAFAEAKACNGCFEVKPLDEFYRLAPARDGHTADCKPCRDERTRARRARVRAEAVAAGVRFGPAPIAERLAARLIRTDSGCMEWQGYRNVSGYGKIARGGSGAGTTYTHRAAWVASNGPIPEGMQVLHRCDNPPCCNPEHLWLGTNDDNMADKVAKGRQSHAGSPRKYTDEQVQHIRDLRSIGLAVQKIVDHFGCSRWFVRHVTQGARAA